MEETNRLDEWVQPPIHGGGEWRRRFVGPEFDGFNSGWWTDGSGNCSTQKHNKVTLPMLFIGWGQWKTYCVCLCLMVHYFLQGNDCSNVKLRQISFFLSSWMSHSVVGGFCTIKARWVLQGAVLLGGWCYVCEQSSDRVWMYFIHYWSFIYGQCHSCWWETEFLTAVQHQGLWLMMNLLSGWIRGTDSSSYNLLGRPPSVRVSEGGATRRREVGTLQHREG